MRRLDDRQDLSDALRTVREASRSLQSTADDLAAQRQYYVDLFELAPEPYAVTDERDRIVALNRAAVELLGLRPERAVGRSLKSLRLDGEMREMRTGRCWRLERKG
jgi:PAS domain-containing protein